ncbi:MAG: orotate phosphoribosyltransferase, partial [Methylocystis sp.]
MSNDRQTAARETAKALIEVQAVLVNVDKPFITTAGWASPVYIDMRKIIAFPRLRRRLVEFATRTIERDIGYESLDIVAGGETAGIPFAAWIADSLMLPMQYVR